MKLLLTSDGLSNEKLQKTFLDLLEIPLKEIKILMIALPRSDREKYYIQETKKELWDLGIDPDNITMFSLKKRRMSDDDLSEFNVIYVCGGNNFFILNTLREIKFLQKIKQLVKKGILYVGVSAGSIMAGPSIEIAGWGSEADENDTESTNFSALNFTEITILPHYHKELEKEVNDFRKKFKLNTLPLMDGQALLINGKEEKVIR